MRAAILLLLACSLPCTFGQKTRPGPERPKAEPDVVYPINLHLSSVQIVPHCSDFKGNHFEHGCIDGRGVVDGKKFEFIGERVWLPTFAAYPVTPGDYKARLLNNKSKAGGLPLDDQYELVLHDNSIWQCTVTGLYE